MRRMKVQSYTRRQHLVSNVRTDLRDASLSRGRDRATASDHASAKHPGRLRG